MIYYVVKFACYTAQARTDKSYDSH